MLTIITNVLLLPKLWSLLFTNVKLKLEACTGSNSKRYVLPSILKRKCDNFQVKIQLFGPKLLVGNFFFDKKLLVGIKIT
jgi:hypothetical protein